MGSGSPSLAPASPCQNSLLEPPMPSRYFRLSLFTAILALVVVALGNSPAMAEAPLRFRVQMLVDDFNEGCALADINRDGKLDIVAGKYWYSAPDYKQHSLRDIARFGTDFLQTNGDHVHDVNGDGWLDIVSSSFGPTQIYWFENPGRDGLTTGKLWKTHLLVDTGASYNEKTMLRDLDADGVPEYIVNSWDSSADLLAWRFATGDDGKPTAEKITLGKGANGHGIGFGDLNGDGLEDILVGSGWYERPAKDAMTTPWKHHRQWSYDSGSCPMLVIDVNEDGRNDIIRGVGHDYGVYWMEQLEPKADGTLVWKDHLIDKSYSQAHSLLLSDLDGDGRPELICGKRVRGHSGKDPGGLEPPCLYYYSWDSATQKFTRHTVEEGHLGTGLQIRTADMNNDGRTDIIVAGKSGTYIAFNEGRAAE